MAQKTTLKTKEIFFDTADQIAQHKTELDKLEAACAAEIQAVQKRHAPGIEKLEKKISELVEQAERYARKYRGKIFPEDGSKTVKTTLAAIRLSQNPPKIDFLNPTYNDGRCIELMQNDTLLARFVRPKHEIDKTSLLAGISEKNITVEDLKRVGLTVIISEKFDIKPLAKKGK